MVSILFSTTASWGKGVRPRSNRAYVVWLSRIRLKDAVAAGQLNLESLDNKRVTNWADSSNVSSKKFPRIFKI